MGRTCSNCGRTMAAATAANAFCDVCTAALAAAHEDARDQTGAWEVRHSRERHFGICLILGIITLGVYFIYWHFAVFSEMARHERRTYPWWLFAGNLGLLGATVVYAIARYGAASGEFSVLRGDPLVVAGVVASSLLWGAFLVIEARRLNRSLRRSPDRPNVPVYPLPAVILVNNITSIFVESMVIDLLLLPLWLMFYYMLHSGINSYWRESIEPPMADAQGAASAV